VTVKYGEAEFQSQIMNESKKRVLVVDDHPLVREGVVRLLDRQTDFVVCGEIGAAEEIWAAIERGAPDVLLLDLALGRSDGLERIKQLRSSHPALPILIISMHDEELYAVRALKAGASGYLMKTESPDAVVEGLRRVVKGEIAVSARMSTRLIKTALASPFDCDPDDPIRSKLSDRELHVFFLIGSGTGTRDIAQELKLSIKTIETYRENIKVKLHLRDAAELLAAASQWVNRS